MSSEVYYRSWMENLIWISTPICLRRIVQGIGEFMRLVQQQRMQNENELESYEAGTSILENVHVTLAPLPKNLTWESLFPVWIDEDHKWHEPTCPEVPLPRVEGTDADVDVVVVKVPCDGVSEDKGLRDVFRLQVNLAAAKLVVESGWRNVDRAVYVVLSGHVVPCRRSLGVMSALQHRLLN
ncbi:hypothetical protein Bca52824_079379 [Brassica carinata]|uniref:Uncharacterized protein n=1 Tax=Brassica carinata TaxID=52824 RepID=A0A8X7TYZ0_BRACI|nr:hypothetical protein Bca52824_079379 [Brassica carinata]